MYAILDQDLKMAGMLDLEGSGCPFYDDLITTQIADDSGKLWNDTLSIKVPYGYPETEKMAEGYSLLHQGDDGRWYCYRINNVTDGIVGQVHVKQVSAVNLAIWELAHTQVEAGTFNSCSIKDAFSHCLQKTDWGIFENGFTGSTQNVTFNQGDTAQASLQAINTLYSCEIRAYVEIYNGRVVSRLMDIVDKLGEEKNFRIEYGHNLLDITREMVDDQLFTKLYVYGGTPSGSSNPISIAGANGGKDYIVDDAANDLYNFGGRYLEGFTQNTAMTNAAELLNWGEQQLALYNHPKYNYTVTTASLSFEANLGDQGYIIDTDMQPQLYLEARIIQKQTSEANPTNNQVVIGEFVEIRVVTPDDITRLQTQAAAINQIAVDAKNRASAAEAKADGKSTTYRSPDAPAEADVNDTWKKIADDGHVIAEFTYTADGWKETVNYDEINNNIEVITYSKNTVFGLSVQEPNYPITNDLWYRDNQDGTSTLLQYDGTKWVDHKEQAVQEVNDAIANLPRAIYSDTEPSTDGLADGSTWYETSVVDGKTVYEPHKLTGGAWVDVFDSTAQQAAEVAQSAQEAADSKPNIYYGTATPTGAKNGDVWNQTNTTDDSVAVKQMINGVWEPIKGLQGPQGVPGPAGVDGQPTYTWVKYATSSAGANMSDDPTGKTYIGLAYNKTTQTESTNAADYQWALYQGPQGVQGPQGDTGATGSTGATGPQGPTVYTWIKYADTPTTGMSDDPTGKQYIGLAYNKLSATESTTYSDYQWARLYDASKKRNFTSTPFTPYDVGDTWTQSGSTYYCTVARASGAYTASDWTLQKIVIGSLDPGVSAAWNTAATNAANTVQTNLNTLIASGNNLVQDSGFEATGQGYDTSQYHSGKQSRKVTANGGVQDINVCTVKTSIGRTYYCEAWVLAGQTTWSGTVGLQISEHNTNTGANAWPSVQNLPANGAQAWTKLSGYVTVPDGYDQFTVRLSVRNDVTSGNVFYFDDVVVIDVTDSYQAVKTTQSYKGVTIDSNGITAVAGTTIVDLDSTNGFKIVNGATTKFQVDTAGNLTMRGNIVAGDISGVNFSGESLTLAGTLAVTGAISAASGGVVLNSSGIAISKGSLNLPNTQIASDGTLTTTNANITGTVTVSGKSSDGAYTAQIKIAPSATGSPISCTAIGDPRGNVTYMTSDLFKAYMANADGNGKTEQTEIMAGSIELRDSNDDVITMSDGNIFASNSIQTMLVTIDGYGNISGAGSITGSGNITGGGIISNGALRANGTDFSLGSASTGRGNGGRALVQNSGNVLVINYANDFAYIQAGSNFDVGGHSINNFNQARNYNGLGQLLGENGDSGGGGADTQYGGARIGAFDTSGNWRAGFCVGYDSTGSRTWGDHIYDRTYGSAANMYVTSSGTIGRSTSATKYKLNIDHDISVDYAKQLLNLSPATWYDKAESEALARHYENGHTDADDRRLQRHIGLIAEEVAANGLERFVEHGAPDIFGEREIEGLEYDRLWVLLIPIIKDAIKSLSGELALLRNDKEAMRTALDNALVEIAKLQKGSVQS
jgi:phage minor structural protein